MTIGTFIIYFILLIYLFIVLLYVVYVIKCLIINICRLTRKKEMGLGQLWVAIIIVIYNIYNILFNYIYNAISSQRNGLLGMYVVYTHVYNFTRSVPTLVKFMGKRCSPFRPPPTNQKKIYYRRQSSCYINTCEFDD